MENKIKTIIDRIREEYNSQQRINYRKNKEDQAINILHDNLGNLNSNNIGKILKLIDADIHNGRIVNRRFGLMLGGRNYNLILKNDNKLLNRLFIDVFEKEKIDNVEDLISDLMGIGEGLVSCLLYLKNREKYNIFLPSTSQGIKTFFPQEPNFIGSYEARYLRFNELANKVRINYKLEPQEIDLVLAVFPSFFRLKDNVEDIDRLLHQLLYESANDEAMTEIVLELVRWSQKDINTVVEKAVKKVEIKEFVGNKWSTLAFSILNSLSWPKKAGEILKALVDFDENNGAYLNNYGIFLHQTGRIGEAINYYARAYATDYKAHGHEKAMSFPAWRNLVSLTTLLDQKKQSTT